MGAHTNDVHDTQIALDGVRRIVHALHESSRWAEKHVGLSGAQLFVLQQLAEGGPASVNEVAARTHTHQSSVSTVVARLVDRGLVKRGRSAADGRRVQLSLTTTGRRLVDRTPGVAQERLARAIRQLPARRRQLLAATLSELADTLNLVGDAPAMFFEARTRPARKVVSHA